MLPNRIPKAIADDPHRSAECRAFKRLEATLDDGFTVFAWVPWLRDRDGGGFVEGEADFLVAHETDGLLVVEIKGGRVRREGESGRWFSRDRSGVEHEVADPVMQCRKSKDAVLRRLRDLPGWEHRWVGAGYAVVLPDCERPAQDLSLHARLEIFAFHEDLANLGPCLRRILRAWTARDTCSPGLGPDGVAALESLVAGSTELRGTLGPALRDEDRAILQLTEDQYRVLDALAGNDRVLVSGAAGTGKTMLAMQQARRLASQGRRTLLTCFNRPLADYLRQSTGSRDRVTIWNFHQLCCQFARQARLDAIDPDGPDSESLPESYFAHDLPRLFLDALDAGVEGFDSIVVDEGQDFLPDYWDTLQLAFKDMTRATLHVFQDAAQDIYAARANPLRDMFRFTLTENLRNTRQIHRVLRGISGDTRTVALGPAGIQPEWIEATPTEEPARLAEVLRRLIREDGVAASDIAVLTTSRREIATLVRDGRIGEFETTDVPLERSARVLVESIPRFKGLERRVVVLAGLRESRHGQIDNLLYVGVGRARTHLVVIADTTTIGRMRAAAVD
jgi:hypothetical protein